ncbi:MAG TPA: T9SS type A sorting domain-containing protein [Ignavibacteria bacterium]|nr:T9SS type A sorting domain-containing protein [Ignavibacteria bacterium]
MKFRILLFLSLFLIPGFNLIYSYQFTPGNIVIVRIGESSSNIPLSNAASKVFLDEYSTNGILIRSIELPSKLSGSNLRLTLNGINSGNGYISTSTDGKFLLISGYDANAGTPNVSDLSEVKKTIGIIDIFGNVNTSFSVNERDYTDNIYSLTSDAGKNFWMSVTGKTKTGEIKFTSIIENGFTNPVINSGLQTRIIKIINNSIYVSGISNQYSGIFKVGNGLPVSSGQSSALISGFPVALNKSPIDFSINKLENIIYVADNNKISEGGGIQKWVNENGNWVFKYILNNGLTNGLRSISVDWSGSSPVIYAITSELNFNKFVKITDAGSSSQFSVLKTSVNQTTFKSLTFAPNSLAISENKTISPGIYNNISINNSEVNISGDITVTGKLELTNQAKILTGSNKIIFTPESELIESEPHKMIIGTSYMQPRQIGTAGFSEFLGVTLSSGSDNIGNVSIKRTTGYDGVVFVGSSSSIATNWEINSDFEPLNGRNVTFSFSSGFDNGNNMGAAEVWKLAGEMWEKIGGTTNILNLHPRSITRNTNSFSKFTIADSDSPLPVELDGFVASTIKNEVILDWVTNHELNNSHFVVERVKLVGNINKYNAVYTELGSVNGSGNSNNIIRYKYNDKNVPSGKYAYRLKQVDYNGNFQFYVMEADVIVGTPSKFSLSQNYPNPFNPTTKINFELATDSKVTLKIYDINGKEIATLIDGNRQAGYYTSEFDGKGLASGMYFAKMIAGDFMEIKKLTLIK